MFRFHFQSAHAADAFQLELTETADPEVAKKKKKNLGKESETGGKKAHLLKLLLPTHLPPKLLPFQ